MQTSFNSIIQKIYEDNDHILTIHEANYLTQVIQKYPYFQIPYFLLSKGKANDSLIKTAMLYSPDSKYLMKFLSGSITFKNSNEGISYDEEYETTGEDQYQKPLPISSNFKNNKDNPEIVLNKEQSLNATRSINEIENWNEEDPTEEEDPHFAEIEGGYMSEIYRMPVKPIEGQKNFLQFSVISRFLNFGRKNIAPEPSDKGDLAYDLKNLKQSNNDDYNSFDVSKFPTITLFKICIEQKKFDAALDIYKSIINNNPEKKALLDSIMDKKGTQL